MWIFVSYLLLIALKHVVAFEHCCLKCNSTLSIFLMDFAFF